MYQPDTVALRSLLDAIDEPQDLRALPAQWLPTVAAELRECLLQSVGESGGHLSAGLGTVELTIALHYVFDTPRDALVWDVGHQCYPHKMLTGRRARLPTIRRRGGLSGFLRRSESAYDAFGAGHSSTSISAALGMAMANQMRGSDDKAVAIIGDGGLTAGLAFEALAHAGSLDTDLLVVLNDNRMSISPNVGAIPAYLRRLTDGMPGPSTRAAVGAQPARPLRADATERAARRARGMVVEGQWFEDLGFSYFGPVDGHDLGALVNALRQLRNQDGPRLLHVVTRKGHGFAPAEADPVKYHGVTAFDPRTGSMRPTQPTVSYTQVFGDWLCQTAAHDSRVVGLTPAMREGSGLVRFAELFPSRFVDVGIAEQHCITLAAGLACQGMRPVVAIYSSFLQRGYDQLVHDIALQNLPVLFAIDRAGLVGPDGATHAGAYDLSFLRCIPGMMIMAPSSGEALRDMLATGLHHDGPAAVRYPRAAISAPLADAAPNLLPIGKGRLRRSGRDVALLVFGTLLDRALEVADRLDATVIDMQFVKPLDETLVLEMAASHRLLVSLEENATAGGAGSAVSELLRLHGTDTRLLQLGLPDEWTEHGTRDQALADAGLDVEGILSAIRRAG
jgi:1-deoxy-D-xylulose-5-phosphate synthase